jgi:hypothetical protein
MKKFSLHPKRQQDPAHRCLIRSMPCIVCELTGVQQTTPTEGHHIRRSADGQSYGTGQKAPDHEMIPLCAEHHWNGVGSLWTREAFEAEFGNERDLLALVLGKIARGEVAA